ncbi:transposase, partial [Acinetobacter sp. KAM398]|uniref:transposase n=1 Tax=Acinetobacter sp. KAM398 TaxID=2799597 RepID=UPI001F39DFB0
HLNLSGHLFMDLKTVIDSAPTLKKPRRTFTAEFKHQLIQQCQQPDISVAKVAMQHQINANLRKRPLNTPYEFIL